MKSKYVGEWILIKGFSDEHLTRAFVIGTRLEMGTWIYELRSDDGKRFDIPCDSWQVICHYEKAEVINIKNKLRRIK